MESPSKEDANLAFTYRIARCPFWPKPCPETSMLKPRPPAQGAALHIAPWVEHRGETTSE